MSDHMWGLLGGVIWAIGTLVSDVHHRRTKYNNTVNDLGTATWVVYG